ncbi:MAG: response regulator, partial [Acidisphaera sp.]|nr:response regulator [Acidisphaera sp.]
AAGTSRIQALGLILPRERLAATLAETRLPRGAVAILADRQNAIVASTQGDRPAIGSTLDPALVGAISGDVGMFKPFNDEIGKLLIAAYARAPATGYLVVVSVPEAVFAAPFAASLRWLAAIGLPLLLLSLTLAAILSRRLAGALQRLGSDDEWSPRPSFSLREVRDLSERLKRTALRQRQAVAVRERAIADLRVLFDTSPVGVMRADAGGRVYSANDAYLRIVGMSRDDLNQGRIRWDDLTPPEWIARDEAAIAEAFRQGGSTPYQKEYLRPDGTRVPVLVFITLDDKAAGTGTAFAVDLSDWKATDIALARAHEQVRESEARLRLATEAGQVGVFDWNLRTSELQWDERVRTIWALPPDAPVTIEAFYAGLHPDDITRVETIIAASLDPATGGHYEAEFRVIGMIDRVERHITARARVWFANQQAIRMLGTAVEVTVQRQAEAVLARDKAALEQLVRERTDDLQATQAELAHLQRIETLGQLASGIAHDFNNVLQAVQGAASLIERRLDDPERVQRLAQVLSEAATRGSAITRRVLAFSRHSELQTEVLDPTALLASVGEILRHTLGAGIDLRIETDEDLPLLLADRGQLEMVLINLATNARDAMSGAGKLTLAARAELVEREIRVAFAGHHQGDTLAPGRYIRFSVADTGIGMTEDVLARVTEPFFTTKPVGKGTGLGLAMVRRFAERSGGALMIQSVPAVGTLVTVWLPVSDDAAVVTTRPSEGPRSAVAGRGKRILLVEDEAILRGLVSAQLESAGYVVIPAESGAAALLRLDAGEQVELVISDLSMPGMDGIALMQEVQRRRPGLPAILLTGFVNEDTALTAEKALGGGFFLLRKPVTQLQLLERVAVLLEGAAAWRANLG